MLDANLFQNVDRSVGRPGMDIWPILVLGLLKQARNVDFDLANNHKTVRQFLGHADWFAPEPVYTRRTIIKTVNLLTPELLVVINLLVVKYGPDLLGQAAD